MTVAGLAAAVVVAVEGVYYHVKNEKENTMYFTNYPVVVSVAPPGCEP